MSRTTRPANWVALPGRPMLALLLLTALAPALPTPEARADSITSFGFSGLVQYDQTANNTPGTNPTAFYASNLNYSESADVTAAAGTSGATATGQASFAYSPSGSSANYQSGYVTPAQLSDYMKDGTDFTANVSSGTLAGQSASVAYGATLFSSAVPYLTGNSYNSLQGLNASQALHAHLQRLHGRPRGQFVIGRTRHL